MGEGRESCRSFLYSARPWFTRRVSHQITLVLIVMTVETQQFPVASIERIIVVVMVLVMDREQGELFTGKLSTAVRAYPGKEFQGKGSIRLLAGRGGTSCHESLCKVSDSARNHYTPTLRRKHAIDALRCCS